MAKVRIKIDAKTTEALIREAANKFYGATFSDVVRQVETDNKEEVRARLRNRVHQVIDIELREMARMLAGTGGLIGSSINRSAFFIQPVAGPDVWENSQLPNKPYNVRKTPWASYSPAYFRYKKRRFRSRAERWFMLTGKLKNSFKSRDLFTTGSLKLPVEVRIEDRGPLGGVALRRAKSALSLSRRGTGRGFATSGDGETGQRNRLGRLEMYRIKLRIFTNLTPAELPYLTSGDIGDVNSHEAILSKIGLEKWQQKKLSAPYHTVDGRVEKLHGHYRPVFEPLLTYWMAQRIPAAVGKALYQPSGNRDGY